MANKRILADVHAPLPMGQVRIVLEHSDKVIGHFVKLGRPGTPGKAVRVEAEVIGCGRFGNLCEIGQKGLPPN